MKKRVQRLQQVCRQVCDVSPEVKRKVRRTYITLLSVAALLSVIVIAVAEYELKRLEEAAKQSAAPPFPVSVNPVQKQIIEHPDVATYFAVHISSPASRPQELSWLERVAEEFAQSKWFQQMASPVARVLVINPGERKEQIADNFASLLDWSDGERETFLELVKESSLSFTEGLYFPDRYLTHKDATPQEIALMVTTAFDAEVLTRYPREVEVQVPLEQTLIIASLLEREAYAFTDMREIAGIIWNRIFMDMNLQLDATLQYAKASESEGGPWWPRVVPDDKYIDSPFNTYENAGLPPAPIASPSLDALLAALNPVQTDCIFYFHDDNNGFHCSETYEQHVQKLRQIYGRGR